MNTKSIFLKTLTLIPIIFFFGMTLISIPALAQNLDQGSQVDCPTDGQPINTGVGGDTRICFKNPLGGNGGVTSLKAFIEKALDIILTIGVPLVALAIIYCGFLFVMAQGEPAKLTKAKEALLYTIIGAALLLGAWVLAQAISGTIQEIAGVQ
jgi:hypothetical protein